MCACVCVRVYLTAKQKIWNESTRRSRVLHVATACRASLEPRPMNIINKEIKEKLHEGKVDGEAWQGFVTGNSKWIFKKEELGFTGTDESV